MSIRSNRPTMNEIMTTLPFAQNKYKDVPKTSMDESHNRYRRGSRGANSPANEYYAQYPLTDREPMKQANGLSKFKSMADLTLNNADGSRDLADDSKMFSSNKVQASAASLLADNQFRSKLLPAPDKPEYEPTKRDVAERRAINDAGLSRSIQALPTQQPVESSQIAALSTVKPKTDKFKNTAESMLNIDSALNNRVIGTMRLGSFNLNKDSEVYRGAHTNQFSLN